MLHNDTVTTRQVSFRWDGKQLTVTTQQEQWHLQAAEAMELLNLLFQHKAEIFAVMHQLELPDWVHEPVNKKTSTTTSLQTIRLRPVGDETTDK